MDLNRLPTLKELGLPDRRCKVDPKIKDAIKAELERGGVSMNYLAKKYKVSMMTVRVIKDPMHIKSLIKKSLDSRGGSSVYYKKQKEKQYAAHKDIAVRKLKAMEEKENKNDQ